MLVRLIKILDWSRLYVIAPGFILLGVSFSLLIRLRRKYLFLKDIEKVIEFDALVQFRSVLTNMVNASQIFNYKSPLFVGFSFSKVEALKYFSKALNIAYSINEKPTNAWLSNENTREYFRKMLLSFVDAGNKQLAYVLNSSTYMRINVLYINRPTLSTVVRSTNLKKKSKPKQVSFFGDRQGIAKLDEIECKLNLQGTSLTCLGVLKYTNNSDDLYLADKIDIDHFTEDFIRHLDAIIEENSAVKKSVILLESDDRVKLILAAAINSILMKAGYENRVYVYYDTIKLSDSVDDEVANLLHQMQAIVANEASLQFSIANDCLIY